MCVTDSSDERRALPSLPKLVTIINFSLRFRYLQIFLPIATFVKIAENDEKFRKIKTKNLERYLYTRILEN